MCSLQLIPSVKKEEKDHMHAHFGDVAGLYHSYNILFYFQKRKTES